MQVLDFTSETYRQVSQIGQFLRGHMLETLFSTRKVKLEQDSEFYSHIQDKWARTNTFDANCSDPIFKGKVLTISYLMSWYNGGGAHPTHGHKTFAFLLEPLVLIGSLADIFKDAQIAFPVVQKEIRAALLDLRLGDEDGDPEDAIRLEDEWVNPGTEKWSDFDAFVFNTEAIDIHFSSYQVGPFVIGTPHVSIPYAKIGSLIRDDYVRALEIWKYAR